MMSLNDPYVLTEAVKLARPGILEADFEIAFHRHWRIVRWDVKGPRPTHQELLAVAEQARALADERKAAVEKGAALRRVQMERAKAYEERGLGLAEIADALTKQASGDAAVRLEGDAQYERVMAGRNQVKADFPKP